MVTIHALHQLAVIFSAQRVFHFPCQRQRFFHGPGRQQACMHHHKTSICVHHALAAQPIEEFLAIRCFQHLLQSIVFERLGAAFSDHQQMQIVIAKHGDSTVTQVFHEAQYGQRIRSAVDQIADKPKSVTRGIKANFVKQPLHCTEAALNVTNCVSRHLLK